MSSSMRTLHKCFTLTALATYLLVGGMAGLCSLWGSLEIEHHHHSQAHVVANDHGSVCPSHESDCEVPAIPCHDSSEEDGDELTAVTPNSIKPIATPFVGLVPAPASAPLPVVTTRIVAQHSLSRETLRGSPSKRTAQLCRFLV